MTNKTTTEPNRYIFAPSDFAFTIGQLSGKVEALTQEVAKANARQEGSVKDLDQRVEKLEKRKYTEQGVMLVISTAGGALFNWLLFKGLHGV